MFKSDFTPPSHETVATVGHHHLVCWKSVFAGLSISLLLFALFTGLGTGIAGMNAESLIAKEEGGTALFSIGGLWLGLSVVIAIFCGSFATTRLARFVTYKVGGANGMIVAALFFAIMFMGAGNMIGSLATGLGKVAQGAGNGSSDLAANPVVQDTINKAIGRSNLKSDPKTVTEGLTIRLLQGDVESAKQYYAYQTNASPEDVNTRIDQLQKDFIAAAKTAGEKSARAVGDAGLILFAVLLFAICASVLGGTVGAHTNAEIPFSKFGGTMKTSNPAFANQEGSALPYLLGWMMEVPLSLLILIAMLRSVF